MTRETTVVNRRKPSHDPGIYCLGRTCDFCREGKVYAVASAGG